MRRLPPVAVLSLAVIVFAAALAVARKEKEDEARERSVDQIFAAYNKPGSPGCALGVIRDGNFVYEKGYGAASLELGVALTPQSVFYMGSVSKQFTAASVVLAAEQGFLSLDATTFANMSRKSPPTANSSRCAKCSITPAASETS